MSNPVPWRGKCQVEWGRGSYGRWDREDSVEGDDEVDGGGGAEEEAVGQGQVLVDKVDLKIKVTFQFSLVEVKSAQKAVKEHFILYMFQFSNVLYVRLF